MYSVPLRQHCTHYFPIQYIHKTYCFNFRFGLGFLLISATKTEADKNNNHFVSYKILSKTNAILHSFTLTKDFSSLFALNMHCLVSTHSKHFFLIASTFLPRTAHWPLSYNQSTVCSI